MKWLVGWLTVEVLVYNGLASSCVVYTLETNLLLSPIHHFIVVQYRS